MIRFHAGGSGANGACMTELAKTFDPAAIESRWYAHWEQEGLFRPDRPNAEPWTIVNPPPNVTGSLHIGHALDNTLQDILARHARLKGKDALWVVGTDHAGIATQMVVERQMAAKGEKRTDLSREAFVEKVSAGGIAAMELVAKDLKSMGLYLARSVSYDGVDYRTLVHDLEPHQAQTYDRCAQAWQVVLRNIQSALEVTKADKCGRARAGRDWVSDRNRLSRQIRASAGRGARWSAAVATRARQRWCMRSRQAPSRAPVLRAPRGSKRRGALCWWSSSWRRSKRTACA